MESKRQKEFNCTREWPTGDAIYETFFIGSLVFHQLALIVSAIFMCLSMGVSFWLILQHALHYLKPYEQKHIIRILAMIPIYSVISFFSLLFYQKAVFLELTRNCYEAYVVASFFTLMCHYVAPNLHEQKEYFRNVRPIPWIFPLKRVKSPRSGLTYFNIIYVGIFQFCITRPLFTVIAMIAREHHSYCSSSTDPDNGYLWIALLQGAFVLIAMYCLLQFYSQLKKDLSPHKPFLKVLCIKLVMFLCFWQAWILGLLATTGKSPPLQSTKYVSPLDIHLAIPCILICFEMTVFACIHHWAFPWKPYDLDNQLRGPDRRETYAGSPLRGLLDALNPWDYAKAAARGFRWLFRDIRYRKDDASYRNNSRVLEIDHHGKPFRRRTNVRSEPDLPDDMKGSQRRAKNGDGDRRTVG